MSENVFLKIINREIPAEIVYETEDVLAFRDIDRQAPVHILIIPKQHISTLDDVQPFHTSLLGQLLFAAKEIARAEGINDEGYRVVMNCKEGGGQSVYHIHLHLLGGRQMQWPPG